MALYRRSRGKCKELREKRFGLNLKGLKLTDGERTCKRYQEKAKDILDLD